MGTGRICKRCLLREIDEDATLQTVRQYIDRISQDEKADSKLYEERLMVCKECDYLNSGLCGACGCFVEMRAVIRDNVCPYEKW